VSYLDDITDDRRSAKPWLPADDRDVTNGLVTPDPLWGGRPSCVRHGAMNRIDPTEKLYRCQVCGVGARWLPANTPEAKRRFSRGWDLRVEEAGLRA
jgi:hypothetical protein